MERKRVIIDCDPGIDDSLALMLALNSPELEVVGITIVCGNVPVELGFENAKKILKLMNRLDIPIYKGEEKPLKREYVSAQDTHGMDGLGESAIALVEGYEKQRDAVTYLEETLSRESISIIALGPMTNLARLLERNEELVGHIEEMVSMGGNFRSHGNCSPVAEYNYWCDPDAAAYVYQKFYEHHKLIHMIGLDVTRRIVLTPTLVAYMKRLNKEIGSFVEQITNFYMDFHWEYENIIGCVINDPLAVAYFFDRSLCNGFEAYTEIANDGICMGQSVVDSMHFYKKHANSRVLVAVDNTRFMKVFIERLTGGKTDEQNINLS